MLLKAETNELLATWTDTFQSERGFRVERRVGSGAWETQETLAAVPGIGSEFRWQKIIDESATYRVVALRDDYFVPLEAEPGASAINVELSSGFTLEVDQPGTLHGQVQLSVAGAASAHTVRYFADLELIAASSVGPSFPVPWGTQVVADGNHLLLAHVESAPGSVVELRRSVVVDNPNVAVSIIGPNSGVIRGTVTITAKATSDAGIRSVEFFLNGTSLALLNAPDPDGFWRHQFDTRGLPAPATIRVVATDDADDQAQAERRFTISNAPILSLTEPVDGGIVSGVLHVSGAVEDDAPGTVVTAALGDVQFLETSSNSFTATYSLAGLPGGAYTLTVRARDTANLTSVLQRTIVVPPATGFDYEFVGSYPFKTTLLASEANALLYRLPDRTVRLRDGAGAETTMVGSDQIFLTALPSERPWQLSAGRVAVAGELSTGGGQQVYLFSSSGERTNVSQQAGSTATASDPFLHPILRGPWLVWRDGDRFHDVYNLETEALTRVPNPAPGILGVHGVELVTTPGSERLFFSAGTGAQASSTTIDMFSYELSSGSTTPLSGGGGQNQRPKTDNARIAWRYDPHGARVTSLVVAPVTNPTSSAVVSPAVLAFDLNDGLLAWVEAVSNSRVLKVDDSAATTTVASALSINLYSTAAQRVIFGIDGKLYVWSSATGTRLLLDVLPREIVHHDGVVFFSLGSSQVTVYRVLLQ